MKINKELLRFCKEHSTEIASFCIGVGVGVCTLGCYCFGPITGNQSSVILTTCGKGHKNIAQKIGDWWTTIALDKTVFAGTADVKPTDEACREIAYWVDKYGKDFKNVAFLLIGCNDKNN